MRVSRWGRGNRRREEEAEDDEDPSTPRRIFTVEVLDYSASKLEVTRSAVRCATEDDDDDEEQDDDGEDLPSKRHSPPVVSFAPQEDGPLGQPLKADRDEGYALLASSRPAWAAVRWINVEVCKSAGQEERGLVLKHVLRQALGKWASDLAYASWSTTRQRAKWLVFGKVMFLLAKIPGLPDELLGVENVAKLEWHIENDVPTDSSRSDTVIDFERIVFLFDADKQTVTTIQTEMEGDVWDGLRDSIRRNKGGHHDCRRRTAGILLYNLLNEALRSCDDIDASMDAIVDPMLEEYEGGYMRIVTAQDRRLAAGLKAEMQAMARQVLPLRDAFLAMADHSDGHMGGLLPSSEKIYFLNLKDEALRIMDTIQENADNADRLREALIACDEQRDAKVQLVMSLTLSIFSPLSFLVGLYGMNFQGRCTENAKEGRVCPGGMPELYWRHGYLYFYCLCLAILTICLVIFFRFGILHLPEWKNWMPREETLLGKYAARASLLYKEARDAEHAPKPQYARRTSRSRRGDADAWNNLIGPAATMNPTSNPT